MLWVIKCRNKQDIAAIRTAALPEHRIFLDSRENHILFAGGLQNDEGTDAIGAMFIVNVAGREQAQGFIDAEPLNRAGVFETVTVERLVKGRFHPHLIDA
ncbi:YciI family protein [Devosia sp. A369]